MQLSHTPPLPVNQSVRGDMPNDARPSSDEDEGQSGIRSSPYIRPHSTTEPTRSSGLHSRPLQSGPICSTPGTVEHRLSDRIKQKQKQKQKLCDKKKLCGKKCPLWGNDISICTG